MPIEAIPLFGGIHGTFFRPLSVKAAHPLPLPVLFLVQNWDQARLRRGEADLATVTQKAVWPLVAGKSVVAVTWV
jgi:hypothetical protein